MRNIVLRLFEFFCAVFLMLLILLAISGVSFFESLRFASVTGLICISGGQLWKIISKNYDLDTFEFIGMGLAFGSVVSSGLQIVLRTSPLSSTAWILVCVFIPIGLKIESLQELRVHTLSNTRQKSHSLVLANIDLIVVVTFALAWHWWWIYPFAIASLILSQTSRLYFRRLTRTTFKFFVLSLLLLAPMYVWCTTLRLRNDLWRVISHDQVFSESLSWSLISFGRNDSPFLSGIEINYHWLALHWAGLLTQASHGGSWISVTQLIPITSYLGMFCLLVTISNKIWKNTSRIAMVAIPFLFLSNTFGFNLERFLVSPTFQFTCVWMLATFVIFITFAENPSVLKTASMGLMLFATFGGKAMNGLVALCGLTVALLAKIISLERKQRTFAWLSLIIALIATLSAYFYFFRSTAIANTNTLKIGLQVGSDVGIINPKSGIPVQIIASLIFNLSVSIPVIIGLICIFRVRKEQKSNFWLLSASMIGGILATSITTHEGASQLYFIMSAIVISLALLPKIFIDSKFQEIPYWKMALCSGLFGVISQVIWNQSNEHANYRESIYIKLLAVCLIPCGAFIFLLCLRCMKPNYSTIGKGFVSGFCSFLLLSSISMGILQRIEKFPEVSRVVSTNPRDPSLITGSEDHLEILNWIRQNTSPHEILAINRFCIPGVESCIMKWQLVSAISHRRVLIEGGYGSPTQLQSGEIQNRYNYSYQFAYAPNETSLMKLCEKSVSWFVYDIFGISPRTDWFPYASVKVSTDSVQLLKLNCSSNLVLH